MLFRSQACPGIPENSPVPLKAREDYPSSPRGIDWKKPMVAKAGREPRQAAALRFAVEIKSRAVPHEKAFAQQNIRASSQHRAQEKALLAIASSILLIDIPFNNSTLRSVTLWKFAKGRPIGSAWRATPTPKPKQILSPKSSSQRTKIANKPNVFSHLNQPP